MRVCFTTVYRYQPPETAGRFVCVDWEHKSVQLEMVITPDNPKIDDPNPGGNTRGGRGIEVVNNQIVVAGYHTLKIFDMNLQHQADVSHPLFVDLHELRTDENQNLLLTSTAIDAVFLFDLKTQTMLKEYWPREMPALQKRWNLEPLELDKQADNRLRFLDRNKFIKPGHLHLNAVAKWRGQLYAYLNRYGAVINLDTRQVVLDDPKAKLGHNLIILEDGTTFINDSTQQFLRIFDLQTGQPKKVIDLKPFHRAAANLVLKRRITAPLRKLGKLTGLYEPKTVMPFFVRGMDMVDDLLFIGISPAAILCVDWKRERIVDVFDYAQDMAHAVHGVKVIAN